MSDRRTKYDEDFKKSAVQLSYASLRSVREVAEDLDISEALLYRWRKKYTKDGEKTPFATLEEENRELRKELAEKSIEVDMLRKATVYFASLHKNGMHS